MGEVMPSMPLAMFIHSRLAPELLAFGICNGVTKISCVPPAVTRASQCEWPSKSRTRHQRLNAGH